MDRRLALVFCLMLVMPAPAAAGVDQAGTTAANFLSVGAGAGPLGMAGAGLALSHDLASSSWNAAALGALGETQFTLSHATLAGETQQDWIAVGGRWGRSTRWALSGLYQGEGSFEGRDALGVPTGDFSASSLALGATLARPLGERLRLGLGAKYVREDLGGVSGAGFTFDAGLQMDAGWLSFGAAAQNLFGQMTYESSPYRFPTNFGLGVALTHPTRGLRLALDFDAPAAYYQDVRLGAEWRHRDMLALRAGYRHELGAGEGEPLSGPSFGLGAGLGGFWFDYGYVVDGQGGGAQHRLGVTLVPGRFGRGATMLGEAGGAHGTSLDAAPPRIDGSSPAALPSPAGDDRPAGGPVVEAPAAVPSQAAPPAVESAPAPAIAPPIPAAAATPSKAKKARPPKPSKQDAATAAPTTPAEPGPAAGPVSDEAVRAAAGDEPAAPREVVEAPAATAPPATTDKLPKPEKSKKPAPAKVQAGPAAAAPAVDVPESVPAATPATAPRPSSVKVRPGESLADIAARHGTSAAAIMMENNLVSEKLKPGQVLKLPKAAR